MRTPLPQVVVTEKGWLIGQGTLRHAFGKNVGETEGVDFSPEPVLIEVAAPGRLGCQPNPAVLHR